MHNDLKTPPLVGDLGRIPARCFAAQLPGDSTLACREPLHGCLLHVLLLYAVPSSLSRSALLDLQHDKYVVTKRACACAHGLVTFISEEGPITGHRRSSACTGMLVPLISVRRIMDDVILVPRVPSLVA